MKKGMLHGLEVWGDNACFSRPEVTERTTYPIPTHSACRGIFDAIYWKRSANFYWQIVGVEVVNPIRYMGIMRNEMKDKVTRRTLQVDLTTQKHRTQKHTRTLLDPRYRIFARAVCRNPDGNTNAIDAQFRRRAERGQCFHQPFLGCKEFMANFQLVPVDEHDPSQGLADLQVDVGVMVYDTFNLLVPDGDPSVSVFHAQIKDGAVAYPEFTDSAAVFRPGGAA